MKTIKPSLTHAFYAALLGAVGYSLYQLGDQLYDGYRQEQERHRQTAALLEKTRAALQDSWAANFSPRYALDAADILQIDSPTTEMLTNALVLGIKQKKPLSFLQDMINRGADVNGYGSLDFINGMTPLIAAIGTHDKEALSFLKSKGADLNAPGITGGYSMQTPLSYALISRNNKAVKWLLDHGADPGICLTREYPLTTAIRFGDRSVIDLFLNHPKVDVRANEGEALHAAINSWQTPLFKILVEDHRTPITKQHLQALFDMQLTGPLETYFFKNAARSVREEYLSDLSKKIALAVPFLDSVCQFHNALSHINMEMDIKTFAPQTMTLQP